MIWIFTLFSLSLFRIPESIATPYSVNTKGGVLRPPQLDLPIWNSKLSNSSFVSWNKVIREPGDVLFNRLIQVSGRDIIKFCQILIQHHLCIPDQ
jgi:hypothetical protein